MHDYQNRIAPAPASAQAPVIKPALAGFEHVNRYWDRTLDCIAAKILPGEYYVTLRSEMITTVLGSCVSACIRDRKLGIGGMNHFMLPHSDRYTDMQDTSKAARYGGFAMESLINEILKNGGRKQNLEVKLFGGGQVLANMTDIGGSNIRFVREFLAIEGIDVVAEDLGGRFPRKVIYFPDSGKARVKKLRQQHNDTIARRETDYMAALQHAPIAGDIELF